MPLQASLTINCQTAFQSRRYFFFCGFHSLEMSCNSVPCGILILEWNISHHLNISSNVSNISLRSYVRICSRTCTASRRHREPSVLLLARKNTIQNGWPRPLCTLFQLYSVVLLLFFCAQFSMHIFLLLLHTLLAVWFSRRSARKLYIIIYTTWKAQRKKRVSETAIKLIVRRHTNSFGRGGGREEEVEIRLSSAIPQRLHRARATIIIMSKCKNAISISTTR
jgi:hypothetical protein